MFFITTDSTLRIHNGKLVKSIQPLDDVLYDFDEVGPMYEITLSDGTVLHSFEDELSR